ncbi:hypothetical protein EUX98_g5812 [Antrodiella citrinella]|uniref:Trimethylguanosine synthase n=1 Tax=Antrodiella citrinella TaxID=2447956 RepID=A0A4S4MQV1_9APHY|nr:hypothetical protein EUX98_g5812 [Antrodiella citrinella]
MGKRKNLGGLAHFVKDVFKVEPSSSSTLILDTESPESADATAVVEQIVGSSSTGTTQAPSHVGEAETREEERKAEPKFVSRPSKKRKVGLLGPGYEKYDATGLTPHYTHVKQVPEKLRKYFSQRNRYFSLYSKGCLLDEEGWYSVTPELIADQIADRCRCGTVLDAFCGVGGNAIAFAKTCERVIALDTSPVRLALARHNAALYEVADRIEFILTDYISFAKSYLTLPDAKRHRKIDVVFLSPPWGGPEYLSGTPTLPSTDTEGRDVDVPPSQSETKGKEKEAPERVEIEEEWMGTKLKALTCYFGGLAGGQEHLFEKDLYT